MKRNENRPGYKKTKIGCIPEEWEYSKIEDVCKVIFSSVDKKTNENEYPVFLCNYTDVYYNKYITKSVKFMEATASEREIEKYSLYLGDVIITKDSETQDDIAVSTLVREELSGVLCGYHLAIIRPTRDKLLGEYLANLFNLHFIRYYFSTLANGVTRFGLNSSSVNHAIIPLPPLPEQKKIAEILSTWDRAIELVVRLIAAKERFKKGLMQKLLTGKVRFPGHTDEWREVRLGETVKFRNGKGHEQFINKNGKYVVVNSKFISTEGKVKKFSNKELCPLFSEEIVMVMSDIPNGKALAKCFYIVEENKYTLNQRICGLTPKNINGKFLFYILNRNPFYLKFNDGVNQTNLRKDDILACPLKLPSFEEQQKIASILSECDKEIELLKQEKSALDKQKKGLMQKLLMGEVRVKTNE